jgi:hypothetical protein
MSALMYLFRSVPGTRTPTLTPEDKIHCRERLLPQVWISSLDLNAYSPYCKAFSSLLIPPPPPSCKLHRVGVIAGCKVMADHLGANVL